MRVLYDHQAFQMQYFGGVSKCFCELIKHLPQEVDATISIVQSDNVHLWESQLVRGLKHVLMDHHKWNCEHPGRFMDLLYLVANKYLPLNTADSQNRRITNKTLQEQHFDIFHPTYFKPEFLNYLGRKPFVLTVHDMMPELYPQQFGSGLHDIEWKRLLVKKASAIVAVSENTKKDLIDILNVPEHKISVIYHGGPRINGQKKMSRIIKDKYILYVGQRNFYKNYDQMLRAFCAVKDLQPFFGVKMVCTGAPFTEAEQRMINELGLRERVIFMHPSDAEIQILYRDAMAFVYPSEYEGFGMPILEAFANGCPCVLNDASCFPEVAKEAAVYFSLTQNGASLSDALLQVAIWNDAEREAMVQKGYDRLSHFSWEKSANQLYQVYKTVI